MATTTLKRIYTTACLLVLLSGAWTLHAQDSLKKKSEYIPAFAVKWSPFHLIYFYPSLQLAIEHKVWRNTTMQYDVGWILNYRENNNDERYANKHGYRLIAELRHYLPFTPSVPFYIAAEGYYHNIQFDRNDVIGYDYDDSQGLYNYYQYVHYKVRTKQSGGGLKIGMLLYPAWNKNKSFFIDVNGGLAVRNITYKSEDLPTGNFVVFEDEHDNIFAPSEKNHVELRPVLGMRIGYKFR